MAADGVVWPGGSPIRRVFAALFAAALLIASAGCAERPKNVLLPVSAGAPGTSKVDLLVVTTRQESTDPGEMFTGERGLKPAFADITVSIPPDNVRKEGEVAWPKRLPADPATDFAVLKANEIDEATARKWFNERVSKTPDHAVLVFIHGFNNRFEDSVFRLAQIVHDFGTTAVPVLVTWPSRGKLTAYGYDRESTNYSRNAIEKLFQALGKNPNVKDVSILAHSMGNMLALEGLRQMAIRNGHLPAKFKNVMLAAPDVDVDVFRSQIADMGNPRPKFTLFVSRDDRALAMSRRVWGNVARLGAIDPDQEPYKSELETNNITVDRSHPDQDRRQSAPFEIRRIAADRAADRRTPVGRAEADRYACRAGRFDRRGHRRRRRGGRHGCRPGHRGAGSGDRSGHARASGRPARQPRPADAAAQRQAPGNQLRQGGQTEACRR